MRLLHARHRHARRAASAPVIWIARSPRTSVAAPVGGRSTTRSAATLPIDAERDLGAAARRAELEGGVAQVVRADVPLGGAPFADDTAPRDALVAVPLPPGSSADAVEADGLLWVVGPSLLEARTAAGKVQGRRTTAEERPPLFERLPACPPGGVRLATSWVEPAYLEPDASWCEPGGVPASPVANGGAFGGKLSSRAPSAARELADRLDRPVRVVYAREDVVRLGPKRPPIAASAVWRDGNRPHRRRRRERRGGGVHTRVADAVQLRCRRRVE